MCLRRRAASAVLVFMKIQKFPPVPLLSTGIDGLDNILGGGLTPKRVYLVEGEPGTGKTITGLRFLLKGARPGESAVCTTLAETDDKSQHVADSRGWSFKDLHIHGELPSDNLLQPEAQHTMRHPPQVEIDTPLRQYRDSGLLRIQPIDPAELSPGEFASTVCKAADDGACVGVIDSINADRNVRPDERFLTIHSHQFLTSLDPCGVVTVVVGVQQVMPGGQMSTVVDASYPANNGMTLRYFEHAGEVKQAIPVCKKRGSLHERIIRQFSLSSRSIELGAVLRRFRSILTGVAVYGLEAASVVSWTADDGQPVRAARSGGGVC